jgi:hypothetical protein
MTSKETMYKAINIYGVENQMIKTVEEGDLVESEKINFQSNKA